MIEVIVKLDLGTSSAKALNFRFSANTGFWEEPQGVNDVQAAQRKHRSQSYFVCPLHMEFPDDRDRQANQHYIDDTMQYQTSQEPAES